MSGLAQMLIYLRKAVYLKPDCLVARRISSVWS
jgi:hypothetical protein